jgi:hypothetical protein
MEIRSSEQIRFASTMPSGGYLEIPNIEQVIPSDGEERVQRQDTCCRVATSASVKITLSFRAVLNLTSSIGSRGRP